MSKTYVPLPPEEPKNEFLTEKSQSDQIDPNRSIVEIPERKSVASLRSAIESKLNGSLPVKVISSPIFAKEVGKMNKVKFWVSKNKNWFQKLITHNFKR